MLIIADTSALISLGHVKLIHLIDEVFGEFYIPEAVWTELTQYKKLRFEDEINQLFQSKVKQINSSNHLNLLMDFGESEAVILYEELGADFLLIDDRKARAIAESFQVTCVGSIGLLVKAKQKGLIKSIRPIFKVWVESQRYFSISLLNRVLSSVGESPL